MCPVILKCDLFRVLSPRPGPGVEVASKPGRLGAGGPSAVRGHTADAPRRRAA
jgi:hypothetical protein